MRGLDHTQSYRAPRAHGTGDGVDAQPPRKSLQHTLNNPLAGLLAELQLLEMDELTQGQREGVERAIALVRRLVVIVREEVPHE